MKKKLFKILMTVALVISCFGAFVACGGNSFDAEKNIQCVENAGRDDKTRQYRGIRISAGGAGSVPDVWHRARRIAIHFCRIDRPETDPQSSRQRDADHL